MSLSIVIPVKDEAPNVAPLLAELEATFDGVSGVEVLFVDDGSTDGTFEALRAAAETSPLRVRGLRLAAHGGKAAAYQAGFRAAEGALVATMDGDLQDDPKDVLRLRAHLESENLDLVIGWKQTGKSSRGTFVLSRIMNLLLRLTGPLDLHDMNCPLRVMRAPVAKGLELHRDYHRYVPMLAAARGARVGELPVANRERQHGTSKYSGTKYFSSALALLSMRLHLAFGHRPMVLFGTLGLVAFLLGLIICAWVALSFVFLGTDIDDDLPTLILGVLLLLIGTQFLSLGMMAEMIERRLTERSEKDASQVAESF